MTNNSAVQWHSFEYGTHYANCAAIQGYFVYFLHFMTFWSSKKSKYAKPLQFFVTWLWCCVIFFLIEWQSFVTILFERCLYFLAHVTCWNLPWQGLLYGWHKTAPYSSDNTFHGVIKCRNFHFSRDYCQVGMRIILKVVLFQSLKLSFLASFPCCTIKNFSVWDIPDSPWNINEICQSFYSYQM